MPQGRNFWDETFSATGTNPPAGTPDAVSESGRDFFDEVFNPEKAAAAAAKPARRATIPGTRPPALRGPVDETLSSLGAGLAQTAEGIGGTMEMLGIPGGETTRKYWQEAGQADALRRPDYLQNVDIVEQPEILGDWRWWVRSLGENTPNMAAMMLPGVGAMRGAQALNLGAKAIRAAALAGSWGGSFTMEAGGAYGQAKDEMTKAGILDADTVERIATMEGLTAGATNAVIELLPFDNLFLRQAGADRFVKRIIRQGFLEGSTEGLQEAVNIYVEKLGHKPDQELSANVGRLLESAIIGGALGAGAGGTVGTIEHRRSVKAYNTLADQTGVKEQVFAWKAEGLPDKEISARLDSRLKELRGEKAAEGSPDADLASALAPGSETKTIGEQISIPEVDAEEMTSFLLYGQGKPQAEPGPEAKSGRKRKRGVLGAFGLKESTREAKQTEPGAETATETTSVDDPLTMTAAAGKDIATADSRTAAQEEARKFDAQKKGATLFDSILTELSTEDQARMEETRQQDIARREADDQATVATATAQTQEAIAAAAKEAQDLSLQLAGDDPAKQAIVAGVMGLSDRVVLSSVQKDLGITVRPAGQDRYEIVTKAGTQPVTVPVLRKMLAEKQIAAVDAVAAEQQTNQVAIQKREQEGRDKKTKDHAAWALKYARESLNLGRTLSQEQLVSLESARDQLTPEEIARLDAGPAVAKKSVPQSLRALGVRDKKAATEEPGQAPGRTGEQPSTRTAQVEARGAELPGEPGRLPTSDIADEANVRDILMNELATQLAAADPTGWVETQEGGKRVASGGWISRVVAQFGRQATTPLRDAKGAPVTLNLSKNYLANVIAKAQNGQTLTDQQQAVHDAIMAEATDEEAHAREIAAQEKEALAETGGLSFGPETTAGETTKPLTEVSPLPASETSDEGTKEETGAPEIVQPGENLEGDEKKISLLAKAPGTVRVDAPITIEDAGDIVRDFREGRKLGDTVTLKLADSFDALPEEVRKAAEDAGGTKDNTYAVLHKDGSIYLIREAHATREQLEKSIFHEVNGHLGIFRLFGKDSIPQLNRLYNRLGGHERMARIADRQGDRPEFDAYWKDAQAEPEKGMRNARITAELLALIGQKSPSLMQKAKGVWGALRQALRRLGFAKLSEYNDSDLAYLLAEGRKALSKAGGGGEFTLLMREGEKEQYALADEEPRKRPIPAEAGNIISSYDDFKKMTTHPDYAGAKAGGKAAAVRLVKAMVKPGTVAEARKRFGADAIYAAPHAIEAAGRNAIPATLAEYYAAQTDGTADSKIIQTVRAYHTGAKSMDRLLSRSRFEGDVVKDGRYVLVDDVTTMGGTLAELANHIQAGGGKVVGVVTLTNAARTDTLAASEKITREIERRYGNEIRELFKIDPSALTAAEAGYLINFREADTLRNRAATAEQERSRRLRAKGVRLSSPEKVTPAPQNDSKHTAEIVWTNRVVQPANRTLSRGLQMMLGKVDPAYRTALRRFAYHFREFWSPGSTMPDGDLWKAMRARGMGDVARALRFIEQLHTKLNLLPADIKKTMFKVLDGQIPAETLPETFTVERKEKGRIVTEEMKPQEMARIIRRRSDVIGEMMLDRGMIKEAQFKELKGRYIHYAYAYFIIGEGKDGRPPNIAVTPTGKLDLSVTLARNPDLTMQQRYELGLIEDASIAVPLGMGKALTDIAKWDFMARILERPDWVWQPSIVDVPVGAPLKTDQSGRTRRRIKMTIGTLNEEIKTYEKMVAAQPSPETEEKLRIYKESLAKVEESLRTIPEGFKQLPQGKAYGPLAGAYVRETVYNDIKPVIGQINADMGKAMKTFFEIEARAVSAFKFGKVAVNFPTAFRNVISNFIQMNMSGRPFYNIPGDVIDACKAMQAKDAHYEEAFGMGVFHTNWFATEINDVIDEFRKAQGGGIDKLFIAIKNLAKYYGKIDDISKFALFLQQRKEGKTIDQAAVFALKWGMDYSLASRSVKAARRHMIPFISYQYKIAPLIAESLRDRPWVLAKYAMLLPLALEMWAKSHNDLDDDDMEELKKQLPAYVKKSGSMMILPYKTDKGQYQWINAEYFLPWGNMFNIFRDMKAGDVGEMTRDVGITHPLMDIMTMFRSARDGSPPEHPFFGKPIYNELDHPAMKTAKMAHHLAFTFLPSMLSPIEGAAGYTIAAVRGKEDRWGREVTPTQAASRWLGFNIVSVSPEQSTAIASVRIQELKKEMARIDADPSISDERKAASKERMQEKIAGYAWENPEAILPIRKQKGDDPVYEALVGMVRKGILKTGPPGRTIEIAGIPYKMTLDQQREYMDRSSEIAHRKLESLVTSPAWKAMTDKRKTETVSHIMENARKGIRQKIKGEIARANREKAQNGKGI
jgi:hypothetical protein